MTGGRGPNLDRRRSDRVATFLLWTSLAGVTVQFEGIE
jgi:hypothetical protein